MHDSETCSAISFGEMTRKLRSVGTVTMLASATRKAHTLDVNQVILSFTVTKEI
jgi:hypothetical protein